MYGEYVFLQNKYQYFFQIVSHPLYYNTSSTDIIIFQIYGDIHLEDFFQKLDAFKHISFL